MNAWGDYQTDAESEFDRKNNVTKARITRIVTSGDLISSSIFHDKVRNGPANLISQDALDPNNALANHLLRAREMENGDRRFDIVGGSHLAQKRTTTVDYIDTSSNPMNILRSKLPNFDEVAATTTTTAPSIRPAGRVSQLKSFFGQRLTDLRNRFSSTTSPARYTGSVSPNVRPVSTPQPTAGVSYFQRMAAAVKNKLTKAPVASVRPGVRFVSDMPDINGNRRKPLPDYSKVPSFFFFFFSFSFFLFFFRSKLLKRLFVSGLGLRECGIVFAE